MKELNLPNALYKSVDVANLQAMELAIKEAEALYGKVDLLINCAGIMLLGYPGNQDYQEWEQMIDVNIKGILTGTHIILPDMIKHNTGTIINISSIAGRKTFDNHAIYCGSKFTVHAITENIRKEVASKNIRIIVIGPGVVDTPLLSHTSNQKIKTDYTKWKISINGALIQIRLLIVLYLPKKYLKIYVYAKYSLLKQNR